MSALSALMMCALILYVWQYSRRQPPGSPLPLHERLWLVRSNVLGWIGALLQLLFGIALMGAILYGFVWVVHAFWRAT